MKRKTGDLFIRLAAYLSIVIGVILSILMIVVIISLSLHASGFDMSRLFIVYLLMILGCLIIMVISIGIYEFFISYITIEHEVEKLEQEVEMLEEKRGL